MNYRTLLLLTVAILGNTSCTLPGDSWVGYKRVFLHGAPQGNDQFSQGWRDGCDTSLATAGVGTLRLIDEKISSQTAYHMTHDTRYDRGYSIGSSYCVNFLDYNSG